jgi:hypothetical protein
MLATRVRKLSRVPFFLYLLPVFFVLHGFTESYYLISAADSFLLLLKYLLFILILHGILFFLFRKNNDRASFLLFTMLLIYFFFGAFHDALKSVFPNSFLIKYSFLLPFILSIPVLTVMLSRRAHGLGRLFAYLNLLFVILIAIDFGTLVSKIKVYDRQRQLKSIYRDFTPCDTCAKPDIYLIVADEYAGEKTLRGLYQFDNSTFLNQLRERKFYVIKNSISNYNVTPISIASLLNIDYVNYEKKNLSDISMRPVYNLIDTNILVPFFKLMGYKFINNSMFTVNGQSPLATQSFTPVNTRIIESQTLIDRVVKDLGYHLLNWGIIRGDDSDAYSVLKNNNKIIENIKKQAIETGKKPSFSYSHLTMPHPPYYFDSKGKSNPHSEIVNGNKWREDRYLEYLKYANGVLINLIDFILIHSKAPPIIILISDHGFRHQFKGPHEEYDFYNLNATFLPDQYVPKFDDNMSNVSYMRALLNVLFNQHLATNKQTKFYIPLRPGDKISL